jgi:hypothetical protein
MISNSWNIDEDAEAYKNHGKGWKNEDNGVYKRNDSKPTSSHPTQRIGMESSANPFSTTDKYYSTHNTQRTSMANIKNIADPDKEYTQITGEESKSNPLTSKIGPAYSSHKE